MSPSFLVKCLNYTKRSFTPIRATSAERVRTDPMSNSNILSRNDEDINLIKLIFLFYSIM